MLTAQGRVLFLQGAVDVHQAPAIGTQYLMGAGLLQGPGLVGHHRTGNVWHAHAERPTKATAFAFMAVVDALDIAQLAQQFAAMEVGVHFSTCGA